MADVTMPQLGETVTEGTITRWAKQVGDRVEQDEVLFEVSTDKVDSEVPSPYAGVVQQILVQEGDTVDVGTTLAVIGDQPAAGGDVQAAAPSEAQPEQPPPRQEAPAPAAQAPAAAAPEAPPRPAPPPPPPALQPAAEAPEQPAPQPPPPPPPPRPADEDRAEGDDTGDGAARVLSPVVRRLLAEHNLDPAQIRGTGTGGRITRSDVLAAVDARGGAPAPAPAPAQPEAPAAAQAPASPPAPAAPTAPPPTAGPPPAPAAPPAPQPAAPPAAPAPAQPAPVAGAAPYPPVGAGRDDEVVAFTNIRRRTAEHMVRSKATSAHTLTAVEVDYHGVDAARSQARDAFRETEGFSLSYLPFISRAVVDALAEFPRLNASVGNDELIVHRRVHLGIAVDLEFEGLIVPVVKDADTKRLRAIAREVRDLADRARGKRLSADDISGGTFTITNPGPYGTLLTVPIINQPQVAILSTDGVKRKPVVADLAGGGEGIVIHPVGILALAFDHRANDGAYASAFLAKVREIIETRDWAGEL